MRHMRTAIVGTALAGTASLVLAGTATGTPAPAQNTDHTVASASAQDESPAKTYRVTGDPAKLRAVVMKSGAAIEGKITSSALVTAIPEEVKTLRDAGLTVKPTAGLADAANARVEKVLKERARKGIKAKAGDFPAGDEAYHTYDETMASIDETAKKFPDLAKKQSIGKSVEGRDLMALRIGKGGDNAPEVMITCNQHAREHLTTEQCLDLVNELTTKASSDEKIKKIVENRVIYILPMMNPDGSTFDIKGGKYHAWRKTRIKNSDGSYGIDPNRNWSYKWACCGGSSNKPKSETFHGESAFQAVEPKAVSDFIKSRNVNGKQKIKAYLDIHTFSELVLYPFGHTKKETGEGMNQDQHDMLKALAEKMASSNHYTPEQSSALYITDGDSADWNWGDQKIPSVVMELYPKDGLGADGFYPPASDIPKQTERNRQAILDFLDLADCQYRLTGKESEYCKDTPNPGPTPAPTPSPTGSAAH